jgi:hypothetical protein
MTDLSDVCQIDDEKRDNDGRNAKHQYIADVMSGDALSRARSRNNRLLRGLPIVIPVFRGSHIAGHWIPAIRKELKKQLKEINRSTPLAKI